MLSSSIGILGIPGTGGIGDVIDICHLVLRNITRGTLKPEEADSF